MVFDTLHFSNYDEETEDGKDDDKAERRKSGKEASEKGGEDATQVYGPDGSIYFIARVGNGNGNGNGYGKEGVDGSCLWCGKYGRRFRECRSYTSHLQKRGQRKAMAKQHFVKGQDFTEGNGKSGKGEEWKGTRCGNFNYQTNFIGNDDAHSLAHWTRQTMPPYP